MIRVCLKGFLSISAIIVLLFPGTHDAYAHKVNMFAYAEGSDIYVEGYFSDGKMAKNSIVSVYDTTGTVLLSGSTDDDGQFTFPIPEKSTLKIVLNAGMGHRTDYLLSANELTGDIDITASEDIPIDGDSATGDGNQANSIPNERTSNAELNRMIETAVGKAIKPVMRSLSEMREERSLATIVGGIGYIFGVLGIFFYLKARKGLKKD